MKYYKDWLYKDIISRSKKEVKKMVEDLIVVKEAGTEYVVRSKELEVRMVYDAEKNEVKYFIKSLINKEA